MITRTLFIYFNLAENQSIRTLFIIKIMITGTLFIYFNYGHVY